MPQYNYGYNQSGHQGFTNPVMTGDVQRSILEAYIWMFAGLIITGLTSFVFYKFDLILAMIQNMPILVYLLPIVQIGLAIGFSVSMARASANTLRILFLLYALTMGISLSTFLYVYTEGTVYLAFFVSALYFACLVFIGATTKKDLTKLGTLAMVALLVLIVSQAVMMLFGVSFSSRLICIAGLLIFTGVTAWDVQRLNNTMLYAQGQPVAQKKWAIFFALQLYLDFINIFLYILQLLGNNSSSRK